MGKSVVDEVLFAAPIVGMFTLDNTFSTDVLYVFFYFSKENGLLLAAIGALHQDEVINVSVGAVDILPGPENGLAARTVVVGAGTAPLAPQPLAVAVLALARVASNEFALLTSHKLHQVFGLT